MTNTGVKVGDWLCVDTSFGGYGQRFDRVLAITPSGRIKLAHGGVLNPDLSLRGADSWRPSQYRVPTENDIARRKRQIDANELYRANRIVRELTDKQLRLIADAIRAAISQEGETE